MTLEEVKANCKEGWKVNQKIAEAVIKRINICDGECPCHNDGETPKDRICPCKSYRDLDRCHCNLYVRVQ